MPFRPVVNQTANDMIQFLNSLLEVDPYAINMLFSQRVTPNNEMVNHPTVQVGKVYGGMYLSILGLINGFYGTIDVGKKRNFGPITVVYKDGMIDHFARTEEVE